MRKEGGVMTHVALIDAMYYGEIFYFGLIGSLGIYMEMVLKRRSLKEGLGENASPAVPYDRPTGLSSRLVRPSPTL